MSDIAVIVDSAASMQKEWYEENGLHVVQLGFSFGEEAFREFDIPPEEFYERLANLGKDEKPPTTNAPSPGHFLEAYDTAFSTGAEKAVVLTLMKEKSATYDVAQTAAGQHAHLGDIVVIDTHTLGPAQAFIALETKRFSQAHSLEETAGYAEQLTQQARVYAVPATLEFLHKGGRIGWAQNFLGGLLGVKPVISIKGTNGEYDVVPVAKTRAINKSILEQVEKDAERFQKQELDTIDYMVLHTNNPEKAQELEWRLSELFKGKGIQPGTAITGFLPPVIGAHLGPGAVGVGMLYRSGDYATAA
jgi:DegV family protein with EDD domain